MEVGSYKMLGSGRKEGNYETMLNILQYKGKRLKVGVQGKKGRESGMQDTGGGRFGLPVPPPLVTPFVNDHISQTKFSHL